MKKRNFRNNLTINVIIIIGTLIGTMFSYTNFEPSTVKKICFIAIIIGVAIVIYLYIELAIYDYQTLRKENISRDEHLKLLNAIPHLLVFSERSDYFRVLENGDGELIWDFHIIKETNEKLPYLYFPIAFEREKNDFDVNHKFLSIIDAKLDGKKQQVKYILKSIEIINDSYPLESGYIAVPVLVNNERKEMHLTLQIKIKNLFKNYNDKEFVIVDVPYITHNLVLKIEAANNYNLDFSGDFFSAHEANAKNIDAGEVNNQISKCTITDECIIWGTEYPKLGYRYKILFSMFSK